MGEDSTDPFAILTRAFTSFQEEMRNMGVRLEERMGRLETTQQTGGLSGGNPRNATQEDDETFELEEDPPDQQPAPLQPRRRNPNNRGRIRDEGTIQNPLDCKLTPPTFAGKVGPDVYLDWERRMDYIYECYNYSEAKKVTFAAAQLTDHALIWWDREMAERRRYRYGPLTSWEEMKTTLRQRYVPPYYQRDLQRRFRKLLQGSRPVEEYYDEFEVLRNRLALEDSEETLMCHFLEGLNERIARKVERQTYHQLHELLHLAIQVEKQIQTKTSMAPKAKSTPPTLSAPTTQALDKGKSLEIESRFKSRATEPSRDTHHAQGKSSTPYHTRELTCYRCKGRGHISRDCPNPRVMVMLPSGDYESHDEEEDDVNTSIEYAENGESLVILRALNTQIVDKGDTTQRENLFHTRCSIKDKVCHLIIDSGSCTNIASCVMIEKLGLATMSHPRPYKLKWLNDKEELCISKQARVPFSIGNYKDEVLCDIAPMQAGHILLGRPWQHDREVSHNGRTNQQSFTFQNRKFVLAPLDRSEVNKMQLQAKERVNLLLELSNQLPSLESITHLFLPKESQTGLEEHATEEAPRRSNYDKTKASTTLAPKQEGEPQNGYIYSLLIKEAQPKSNQASQPSQGKGMILNQVSKYKPNLLSLGAGEIVSWSKPFQERGNDGTTDDNIPGRTRCNRHAGLAKGKGETISLVGQVDGKGEMTAIDLSFLEPYPITNKSIIHEDHTPIDSSLKPTRDLGRYRSNSANLFNDCSTKVKMNSLRFLQAITSPEADHMEEIPQETPQPKKTRNASRDPFCASVFEFNSNGVAWNYLNNIQPCLEPRKLPKTFQYTSASCRDVHTQEMPPRPRLSLNGHVHTYVHTCIHTQRPYTYGKLISTWRRRPPRF